MRLRRMKKYTIIYEVEVRAKNIEEAEELADLWETKEKAKLKRIKGKKDFLDRYYESKRFLPCQVLSKAKRK